MGFNSGFKGLILAGFIIEVGWSASWGPIRLSRREKFCFSEAISR